VSAGKTGRIAGTERHSLQERDWLMLNVFERGMRPESVAGEFGLSVRSVWSRMRFHGIRLLGRGCRDSSQYCPTCGKIKVKQ
jgi:hypothetical protein